MRIIDRYTFQLFLGYFVGTLVIFVTLFIAIDAMSTMMNFKGVPTEIFIQYYAYIIPEMVHRMIPIASVMGVVLTLGNLNKNNEMVALFASGMGLARIARPLMIGVLGFNIFSYFLADKVMPTFAKQKSFIYYTHIVKNPSLYSLVKTNRIWFRKQNAIFNIKTLSLDGKKAQGLTLYFFSDDWKLIQMMTAREVVMDKERWTLEDGSTTLFAAESNFPLTKDFTEKVISLGEDAKDLQDAGQTSEVLSQSELAEFIRRNKEGGLNTLRYEVDYYGKWAFSFAGLVMSLLGLPFSVGKARSGSASLNVGIVIGLVFLYWVLYSSSITLGQHGHLYPLFAAWAPNFLMSGLGLWLFRRARS
ncbi:MAG TPA: LPS export ABC transporter permease LptG [Pseudobdellovibrionaceae bacterium]|nr:LPS export ABC transporter permease LptG [Pseudobdellovibrionaceae bacterium]